jgi:hypothetical protein
VSRSSEIVLSNATHWSLNSNSISKYSEQSISLTFSST